MLLLETVFLLTPGVFQPVPVRDSDIYVVKGAGVLLCSVIGVNARTVEHQMTGMTTEAGVRGT